MVSRVGFEPTTKGLKVPCSTTELPAHPIVAHLPGSRSASSWHDVRDRRPVASQFAPTPGAWRSSYVVMASISGSDPRSDPQDAVSFVLVVPNLRDTVP